MFVYTELDGVEWLVDDDSIKHVVWRRMHVRVCVKTTDINDVNTHLASTKCQCFHQNRCDIDWRACIAMSVCVIYSGRECTK